MIFKLRVPNFIEKHLIMDFLTADGAKLWADITELRRSFGYGDIPVYMVDDNEEAHLYDYFDAEKLHGFGIDG